MLQSIVQIRERNKQPPNKLGVLNARTLNTKCNGTKNSTVIKQMQLNYTGEWHNKTHAQNKTVHTKITPTIAQTQQHRVCCKRESQLIACL